MTYYHATTAYGSLEDKRPGRHRFVAIATFSLSHESALEASKPGNSVMLDQENLLFVDIGCIDCEEPYSPELRNFCEGQTFNPS